MENVSQMDDIIDSWQVDEYEKRARSKKWYILAAVAAFLMMLFSFFTSDFLFAVIIVIASLIFILHSGHEPDRVTISLTEEGIIVGRNFYDYDDIKNFAVVFKPRKDVKNLYIEFKTVLKHRLTIPLGNKDPLFVRDNLLKYLSEDLERTDEPMSESLARLFKL